MENNVLCSSLRRRREGVSLNKYNVWSHGEDIFCSKRTEMLQTWSVWRNYCGRTEPPNMLNAKSCVKSHASWAAQQMKLMISKLSVSTVLQTCSGHSKLNFATSHTGNSSFWMVHISFLLCSLLRSGWYFPGYWSWEIFIDSAVSDGVKNKVHEGNDQMYVRPEMTGLCSTWPEPSIALTLDLTVLSLMGP